MCVCVFARLPGCSHSVFMKGETSWTPLTYAHYFKTLQEVWDCMSHCLLTFTWPHIDSYVFCLMKTQIVSISSYVWWLKNDPWTFSHHVIHTAWLLSGPAFHKPEDPHPTPNTPPQGGDEWGWQDRVNFSLQLPLNNHAILIKEINKKNVYLISHWWGEIAAPSSQDERQWQHLSVRRNVRSGL